MLVTAMPYLIAFGVFMVLAVCGLIVVGLVVAFMRRRKPAAPPVVAPPVVAPAYGFEFDGIDPREMLIVHRLVRKVKDAEAEKSAASTLQAAAELAGK